MVYDNEVLTCMDSVHDLGGTDGIGKIERGEDKSGIEPYFHEEWEKRVFALLPQTMGQGLYNLDEFRHSIERMSPSHYLSSPYYEHWLYAMEDRLVEHGIISEEELQSRIEEIKSAENPEKLVPEKEDPEFTREILDVVEAGASTMRDSVDPAFDVGDEVKIRNIHPEGHTRCPQYVRRAEGTIDEIRGTFVLPDANAHHEGENPEPVYSVEFSSSELWGEETAGTNETVYIDLWESYLEAE
jgi:nitrile hydratase